MAHVVLLQVCLRHLSLSVERRRQTRAALHGYKLLIALLDRAQNIGHWERSWMFGAQGHGSARNWVCWSCHKPVDVRATARRQMSTVRKSALWVPDEWEANLDALISALFLTDCRFTTNTRGGATCQASHWHPSRVIEENTHEPKDNQRMPSERLCLWICIILSFKVESAFYIHLSKLLHYDKCCFLSECPV